MRVIIGGLVLWCCAWAARGQATTSVLGGGVTINEILIDPNSPTKNFDTDGNGTAEDEDEFVELYNLSAGAVDLSGWELWDAGSGKWFTFPAGTSLGAGRYAVVVAGVQAGGSLPSVAAGDLAFNAGRGSGVINNTGDNVVLYDPATDTFIQIRYNGDSADDPPATYSGFSATASRVGSVEDWGSDTDGVSLVRSPAGDVSVVKHNTVSPLLASPGGVSSPDPCADPATAPMWDGTLEVLSGGRGVLPMTAAAGFASFALDLGASSNIALLEVLDATGSPLADYTGSGTIVGTKNSGFEKLVYTGLPGGEAREVKLVIGAPEERGSVFFLDVTDACAAPRTLYVDPQLRLHAGDGEGAPVAFDLSPAYPNPFGPSTTFRFTLPSAAEVQLEVFDLLGRRVARVARGRYPGGSHAVHWHAGDLPGGVYFYRLRAGAQTAGGQVVRLR